jgi:hypothetical protein
MLELAEGEEQRDVGEAVARHHHHPHHAQREGQSALVLNGNDFETYSNILDIRHSVYFQQLFSDTISNIGLII